MSTELLQRIIDESETIVFFGGAGVSTESGIPDFRSEDGLYHQQFDYPPEEIVSHSFFMKNPEYFYRFYREKFLPEGIEPNAAHYKLAELERAGKLNCVITQNVDGLHQKAGSRNVAELHGSVHRNYCMKCRKYYDADFIRHAGGIPRCTCSGIVKPDVVLYGEQLEDKTVRRAVTAISQADTMIVAGTSLMVYPAAGLLSYFRGEHLVLINRDATDYDDRAELVIRENVGEVLGRIRVN